MMLDNSVYHDCKLFWLVCFLPSKLPNGKMNDLNKGWINSLQIVIKCILLSTYKMVLAWNTAETYLMLQMPIMITEEYS